VRPGQFPAPGRKPYFLSVNAPASFRLDVMGYPKDAWVTLERGFAMKTLSAFDVLGPAMIGPSSSHTAGAARISAVAAIIAGPDIRSVRFTLYGSFAKTFRGHGTDRALLAGMLGLSADDPMLPASFALADRLGIAYEFIASDGNAGHPNTVTIEAINAAGRATRITGVSTGGGSVMLTNINGVDVSITGEYPTLVVEHIDRPGMIANIGQTLGESDINIAFMRVFRRSRGGEAYTVIETDQSVPEQVLHQLRGLCDIRQVHWIEGIK